MFDFPFHIPHIYDSITDFFPFSDLLKFILVNRHWHATFIPILWSDAITFRSKPGSRWCSSAYHDNSLKYHTRRGILNHAQFISALTCQGFQSLRILFDSPCVNLVEINYVIDRSVCPDLDYLVDLMSVNPSLRAVSIENVDLDDKTTKEQVHALLDFLDSTPSITSVVLVPRDQSPNIRKWEVVWA